MPLDIGAKVYTNFGTPEFLQERRKSRITTNSKVGVNIENFRFPLGTWSPSAR
jgi:hypothetical protein